MTSSLIGRVALAAVAAAVLTPAAVAAARPATQPVALVSVLPADGPGGLGGGDGSGPSIPNPVHAHSASAGSDSSGSSAPAPDRPAAHPDWHLHAPSGPSDADPAAGPQRPAHGVPAGAGGGPAEQAASAGGAQASGISGLIDKILTMVGLRSAPAEAGPSGPAPRPQVAADAATQPVGDPATKLSKPVSAEGKQTHAPAPTPDMVIHSVVSGVSKLINSLGR